MIGNYGGSWHYRHTTPSTGPGASCSAAAVPAGTDNTTVSGLTADTAHVFKAYSDGGCATELAAAASFATLMAKLANVRVSARDKSLAVSWDAQTGATGYDVQWRSGAEEWDSTNRQSSATGTAATITTLTNGTEYTIRARSKKSGGSGNTGEWSDEATGTPGDERLGGDGRPLDDGDPGALELGGGLVVAAVEDGVVVGRGRRVVGVLQGGGEGDRGRVAVEPGGGDGVHGERVLGRGLLGAAGGRDVHDAGAVGRGPDVDGGDAAAVGMGRDVETQEDGPDDGNVLGGDRGGHGDGGAVEPEAGRTYAYKAYSDAACASGGEIAEATFADAGAGGGAGRAGPGDAAAVELGGGVAPQEDGPDARGNVLGGGRGGHGDGGADDPGGVDRARLQGLFGRGLRVRRGDRGGGVLDAGGQHADVRRGRRRGPGVRQGRGHRRAGAAGGDGRRRRRGVLAVAGPPGGPVVRRRAAADHGRADGGEGRGRRTPTRRPTGTATRRR